MHHLTCYCPVKAFVLTICTQFTKLSGGACTQRHMHIERRGFILFFITKMQIILQNSEASVKYFSGNKRQSHNLNYLDMCNSLQLCIDIFQFVPGTYHFLDILQRAHQCFRYDDPPRKILRSISPERDEELFE